MKKIYQSPKLFQEVFKEKDVLLVSGASQNDFFGIQEQEVEI